MNHALNADYLHVRERLGLDPRGYDASLARAYAKQAGRVAAMDGQASGEISGHNERFAVLMHEYTAGFAEVVAARSSGLDTNFISDCLQTRTDLNKAFLERSDGAIYDLVQAIFSIACDRQDISLPFFSDIPEIQRLVVAAKSWSDQRDEMEAHAIRQAQWEATLPSAGELKKQAEEYANKAGASFHFEGYTLWFEPDYGGWSLTNLYGVDNCAFLSTEHHFEWLLDKIRKEDEIGPVPPIGESSDDHHDSAACDACENVAALLICRMRMTA